LDAQAEMHGINRNEHFFPRNEHFFRGITETIPSLFRGFFSERNFDGNPNQITKEHPAKHPYIEKILCTAGSNIIVKEAAVVQGSAILIISTS
jgi:hypothetical protein